MNSVLVGKKKYYVKASEIHENNSNTVHKITGLEFKGEDVGNHSICSALAMALYLSKRLISTITLLGRRSSDAFILYIWQQVQEFSAGAIADMVSQESFFAIPDLDDHATMDPSTWSNQSFANIILLNDLNAATAHIKRPAMHTGH